MENREARDELRGERKEKLMCRICDDWCEWPARYKDDDELFAEHCDLCRISEAIEDAFA